MSNFSEKCISTTKHNLANRLFRISVVCLVFRKKWTKKGWTRQLTSINVLETSESILCWIFLRKTCSTSHKYISLSAQMSQVSSSMSYNMEGRRILYRKDMRHGYWSSEETINFHSFSLQFFFFFILEIKCEWNISLFCVLKETYFCWKIVFSVLGLRGDSIAKR